MDQLLCLNSSFHGQFVSFSHDLVREETSHFTGGPQGDPLEPPRGFLPNLCRLGVHQQE